MAQPLGGPATLLGALLEVWGLASFIYQVSLSISLFFSGIVFKLHKKESRQLALGVADRVPVPDVSS